MTTEGQHTDECREAFEKRYSPHYKMQRTPGGKYYVSDQLQAIWEGFEFAWNSGNASDLAKFASKIARMTQDGEEVDGREFVMENDDAVSTLNELIDEARKLVEGKELADRPGTGLPFDNERRNYFYTIADYLDRQGFGTWASDIRGAANRLAQSGGDNYDNGFKTGYAQGSQQARTEGGPAKGPDYKRLAYEFAELLGFCMENLRPTGTGLVLDQNSGKTEPWRKWIARYIEKLPDMTIDHDVLDALDLPAKARRKRLAEIAAAKVKLTGQEPKAEAQESTITVCSACLQASCWQGAFYCEDYKTAGTVEKTRSELEKLNLEHPDYWKEPKAGAV